MLKENIETSSIEINKWYRLKEKDCPKLPYESTKSFLNRCMCYDSRERIKVSEILKPGEQENDSEIIVAKCIVYVPLKRLEEDFPQIKLQ